MIFVDRAGQAIGSRVVSNRKAESVDVLATPFAKVFICAISFSTCARLACATFHWFTKAGLPGVVPTCSRELMAPTVV